MKYYDIEQGSEEWFGLRLGKITSSHFSDIMAYTNGIDVNAKWGKGAIDYAQRIALERKTGKRIESFQSDWMKQGNDNEPVARDKYEQKTLQIVDNGGLFIDDEYGTSPDGLLGDGGGIEIKCVKYNTHFAVIESEQYDTKYRWQIMGQIMIADLEFVDFISYCSEFPTEMELYVYRVEKNNIQVDQLQKRLEQFKKLVKNYEQMLKK